MDLNEANDVLKYLLASYHTEVGEDEQVVWLETLAGIESVDVGLVAVREIRHEQQWFPSHAEFVARAEAERVRRARQHEERMLGRGKVATKKCPTCEPETAGWIEVDVRGRGPVTKAWLRCEACNPRTPVSEHDKACTCLDCKLGPRAADRVRMGRDGLPDRHGPDPLEIVRPVQDSFV